MRKVYFPEAGDFVETNVYDRAALPAGIKIDGPAIVEEAESTLVVGPNATMHADATGNLIVDLLEG
jgi:N-methylhydantoinase A